MQYEVRNTRATRAPELLREARVRHAGSFLNDTQWDDFLLIYKGDVDKALVGYIAWADGEIAKINGIPPVPGAPNVALIPDTADLSTIPVAVLRAEMTRLEQLISADTVIRNQYTALGQRIATENGALQTLKTRLEDARGGADRRKALQVERDDAYERLFDAVVSEQRALTDLYAPLMRRLLYIWRDFKQDDGKAVQAWTARQLADDHGVARLAKAFTRYSWGQGMGLNGLGDMVAKRSDRASVEAIHTLLDRDAFRGRLESLETVEMVKDEDSDAIRRFLRAWRSRDETGD
ncbi:hypothetical protein [Sphingobium mellinum]|uniref:hypothetical protein n=1 Tax=Sphingobium mellinum TaxID=1387166 RepID=UPI0030EEBDEB